MRNYDPIQNMQGNSNMQDWNSLHKSVRNIQELTKVVAETNNEAHYIHERANEAIEVANQAINNVQGMTDEYKEHAAATIVEINDHIDTVEGHVATTNNHVQLASDHEVEAKVAKEQSRLYSEESSKAATEAKDLLEEVKELVDNSVGDDSETLAALKDLLLADERTVHSWNPMIVRLNKAVKAGDTATYDPYGSWAEMRAVYGINQAILHLTLTHLIKSVAMKVYGGSMEDIHNFVYFAWREGNPELLEIIETCKQIWEQCYTEWDNVDDVEKKYHKLAHEIGLISEMSGYIHPSILLAKMLRKQEDNNE